MSAVKGLTHVGVSVANLERSIEFYRNGLGLELVEIEDFGGPQYEAIMRLEGARGRLAILQTIGLQLELFEFAAPKPHPSDAARPVCDHGITHFCIEVIGIDAVCQKLQAAGGSLHTKPLLFFGTTLATYARDIDGNVFELFETIDTRACT